MEHDVETRTTSETINTETTKNIHIKQHTSTLLHFCCYQAMLLYCIIAGVAHNNVVMGGNTAMNTHNTTSSPGNSGKSVNTVHYHSLISAVVVAVIFGLFV